MFECIGHLSVRIRLYLYYVSILVINFSSKLPYWQDCTVNVRLIRVNEKLNTAQLVINKFNFAE